MFLVLFPTAVGRRNTRIRTGGTIYEQVSINAEKEQFIHAQILTSDDDNFGRNMS
jgi:hypothetical protein